jgi:putative transposase
VTVPIYRKKVFYYCEQKETGKIIHQLSRQKAVELIEEHAMPDHIHLVMSVPLKYSFAMVVGYLNGKSAIDIYRQLQRSKKGFVGKHFCAPSFARRKWNQLKLVAASVQAPSA